MDDPCVTTGRVTNSMEDTCVTYVVHSTSISPKPLYSTRVLSCFCCYCCFCCVFAGFFFAVLLCVFAVVLKAQNINLRLTRVNLPEKDPGPSEKETKHMSEDKETN